MGGASKTPDAPPLFLKNHIVMLNSFQHPFVGPHCGESANMDPETSRGGG
jgi:hypothetical protein